MGTCQLGRSVPQAKKVMYTEHIDLHPTLACSTWLIDIEKCNVCTSPVPPWLFQTSP
jgi:hypothetical protein